ncbi:hypothetical protein SteCoe_37195 [Stentor coeruleus]|uniref:RING-type domain-containing protein n=1 Tax=Stentor coeruleus TaxID=5963 RepID=A0A1R2ANM0_9CILI|nr:hypothetical protein SteCoe_37195 [Stentor coeruleus]
MGKKLGKLKNDLQQANSILSSDTFYTATGFRMNLMFTDKIHIVRIDKNIIQVDQLIEGQPPKHIGNISPINLKKAICIGEYINSISSTKNPTGLEENLCCICLDQNIEILLECGHGYCEKDIMDWEHRDSSCPMCRRKMNQDMMYTSLENFKDENELQQSISELFNLIK